MLSLFAFVILQPRVDVQKNVVYREIAGEKLMCDIYRPTTPGRKKAVAVFHGGAWVAGQRQDMAPLCEKIASEGMVAITFQYRLAPKHKWPSMREDALAAIQWIRANEGKYDLDVRQIGALGASAGAHLAMLTGYLPTAPGKYSSRTQAIINFFGPTDMAVDYPASVDALYFLVLGKKRADAAQEIFEASPVKFVDRGDAPTYTMHGKMDQVVPLKQAERLQEALAGARIDRKFHPIDNIGHELPVTNAEVVQSINESMLWLKKYLRVR